MSFDDNDHHTFINSKYYDINDLNALNNKGNYFGILHLNIASLNKHIDSLSDILSLAEFSFPIIELCKHKIRSNSFINNIFIPGYTFCYDKTKSTYGGAGFYINDKFSCVKRNDLNISLDDNLESIFIEVNLPEKKNFICGCIYKHPNMPIVDFNSKYLTPLLEKLNREDKFYFLMDDFNINLVKINSESHNSKIYNTMCSYFFTPLVLQPTKVTDNENGQ